MSALDELRFGSERVLNLREALPTAAQAVRRTENFLREHQIRGTTEVLVITGRGRHSADGVAVVRPAVEKLLFSLKRRGVIAGHGALNPGAFVVQLAPIRSLVEAAPRARDRRPASRAPAIGGLSGETNQLLRTVAERSLDALGVTQSEFTVEDEMHRQLRALAPSLPGGERMEPELCRALRAVLEGFE